MKDIMEMAMIMYSKSFTTKKGGRTSCICM